MKKKIGIFIFIVICSTVMLSDWIERIYIGRLAGLPGRYNSYVGIQKEQKDSIDMLVIGDSESMTSISPMELWKSTGITSYVCGQSAQRISESYYMLKHALDYQSPQVVLLETNMLFRYTNTPDSLRSSISDTAMYYFPVLQYHNLWKNIVNDQIPEGWQSYKGFAIRPGVAPYSKGSYMKKTKKEKEIPQINLWYLDKIRKLCEKNKIQLLLYTSASPVNHNYKRYNAVLKYAGKYGIPYLDFNQKLKELGIDWKSDTLDKGDHLNLSGAHKVTDYMTMYLQEHYMLPDHRGDEKFTSWDTMAEQYTAETGY